MKRRESPQKNHGAVFKLKRSECTRTLFSDIKRVFVSGITLFQLQTQPCSLSSNEEFAMKLKLLPTIAASVIVLVLLECVEAAKEKRGGHRRKLKPIEDTSDDASLSKEPEFIPSVCHKIALRRCGQNFMKLFNLVHYLDGMDHYNAQCALRKAFFACHEKLRQKPCKQKKQVAKGEEKNFVSKLSEAIWATRVCVLGIQRVDEIPQSARIERKRA